MGLFDRIKGNAKPAGPGLLNAEGLNVAWTAAPSARGRVDGLDSGFPRFHTTAGDQPDARGSDRFGALRIRLRSAFTPSLPITERRLFAGRIKVLTDLIRAIEDERLHTVVFGERGLGKTSLMHVLAQTARDARYLVVYITCGAASNFEEMVRTIMGGISLRYHVDYGPTSAEAERGESFADLLTDEPMTVRLASDLLAKLIGTRVLVVLDEFDRVRSEEFRRAMAELLKSLADRSVRVQFVIAGVAANLNELVSNVPSIQRNISAIQVPKMTPAEIRELVKKGEAASGVAFDDRAIDAVIARSIGFPYLASLLAHRAGLTAVDAGRATVTDKDVANANAEAVNEARGRISRRSQVQIDQRVEKGMLGALGVLAGAAQMTGGLFSSDDLSELHADPIDISGARTLLDRLAREDVLIESVEDEFGRRYRFAEESVPTYLWLLAALERGSAARAPKATASA